MGVGGCVVNCPAHLESPRFARANQSAEFTIGGDPPSPTQRPTRRYPTTREVYKHDDHWSCDQAPPTDHVEDLKISNQIAKHVKCFQYQISHQKPPPAPCDLSTWALSQFCSESSARHLKDCRNLYIYKTT